MRKYICPKLVSIFVMLFVMIFSMPVISNNEETEAEEIARRMRELALDEDDELATAEADFQTATTENDDADAFMNLVDRINNIATTSWFFRVQTNINTEITRIRNEGTPVEVANINRIADALQARIAAGDSARVAAQAVFDESFRRAVDLQMRFEEAMNRRDDVEIRRDIARDQAERTITQQVRARRIQVQIDRENELARLRTEREQLLQRQLQNSQTRLEQLNKLIDAMERVDNTTPTELDKVKAIVDYGPTVQDVLKLRDEEDG